MKKNLVLSATVLLLVYAVLEVSFLHWFPRLLPTGFVLMVTDEGLHPLLQTSKRSVIPEHYIALLGDSHAQGMGDWASETMKQPMARYGSAHLLQDTTGKDVVSFGSAGAGSVRAMVTEPLSQLAYIRQFVGRDMAAPDIALVYFYEGNDLYDNAAYFHYSFPKLFDINRQYDNGTYQQYLQQFAVARDQTWRQAQQDDWLRHLPFTGFLDKALRSIIGLPPRAEPVDPALDNSLDPPWVFGGAMYSEPGQTNRAMIGGRIVQLPDLLQGPALNLDAQEWQQAWHAFEQALAFSRQQFPGTQFVLVYIPSVLGTYTLASEQVSVQAYERRGNVFSAGQLQEKSRQMRTTFAAIAKDNGLPLIDTTDAMRMAATMEPLHGPGDWNHPNRRGYEVLSEAIAKELLPILQP